MTIEEKIKDYQERIKEAQYQCDTAESNLALATSNAYCEHQKLYVLEENYAAFLQGAMEDRK